MKKEITPEMLESIGEYLDELGDYYFVALFEFAVVFEVEPTDLFAAMLEKRVGSFSGGFDGWFVRGGMVDGYYVEEKDRVQRLRLLPGTNKLDVRHYRRKTPLVVEAFFLNNLKESELEEPLLFREWLNNKNRRRIATSATANKQRQPRKLAIISQSKFTEVR